MEQLIEAPTFGPAFSFGLRLLPRVFREQWPVFAVMIVTYAVASRYAGDVVTLATWAAQFPAIAVVVQMVRRRFRLTFPGLLGMVVSSLPAIVAVMVTDSVHTPSVYFGNKLDYAVAAGAIVMLFFMTWLGVKFDAASAIYALQIDRAKILDALIGSWRIIAGGMWWRLLVLNICTYGICVVPFNVVERLSSHLFERAPTAEIQQTFEIGFKLLAFVALLISYVWYRAAVVALMSASGERVPVEASPG